MIYDYTYSSADGTVTFSGTQTVDGVTYTYNSDGSINFTADTGDGGDGSSGDGEESGEDCFALDALPEETIVPGAGTSFSITFTPNGTDKFSVDGEFRAQIVINTNCPGDTGEYTFFIEGAETAADGDGDGDEEETPVVSNPVFSVEPGTYTERQTVRITCETPGASIYYTTDGITEPDDSLIPYGSSISFSFSSTTTIKAIAYAEGYEPSSVVTGTYTIEKSIELDKTDITLVVLEQSTYSDYKDSEYILPTISPQYGETVSWSIDDPTVAELDDDNWYQVYVYPKGAGTATITATLEGASDDQDVTATCTVTVLASIEKADDVEFLYHFGAHHDSYAFRTELYIRDNILYFVDSPADLQTTAVLNTFNVSNPDSLGPRNTTDLGYNHTEFLYYNDYLIGFDSSDMTLYFHPLSSPTTTPYTYTVSDFTNFQDIKLKESMVYLLGQNSAEDQMKIVMVNIADPAFAGLHSSVESLSGTSPDHPLPGTIGISGNTIYTASEKNPAQANYLFTIDTSDPQNLTVTDPDIYLQSGADSSWDPFGIQIVTGNSLITQNYRAVRIRFYDLNNLSESSYKDMYFAYAYIQHCAHNNLIWAVCNGWSGQTDQPLDLFDISDPADPHKIGSFYISTEYEYTELHNFGVTATDTHVFVMTSEGLKSFSYATADY
ncbi:MAG: chitobiase/beta-hexosaminidase C-terminal domain-containing protein [Spirochaetia bacterium]